MRRRDLLAAASLVTLLPSVTGTWGDVASAADAEAATPFSAGTVREAARALAARPYQPPESRLPGNLADLSYDKYRTIRFDPNRAMWKEGGLPFQAQFFHRGFLFKERVEIFEVADGKAAPIRYSPDLFTLGEVGGPPSAEAAREMGFAGFRLTSPMNRPDHYDEVASFLGASYFRAIAKGQIYGLSARGLAIATAEASGEEFPFFRSFWIERPVPNGNSIVVHALLDSRSASAAFRFTIRPGEDTVFDVEARIFPRVDLTTAGIAPLTSMFYFAPNDRDRRDDYRGAVHDSDGLMMVTGRGEQLWRPLNNPRDLQVSGLGDTNPRGFGLMQRRRAFADYNDLEARYEKRPSLWVEPIGDWGPGAVHLVEIPTGGEIHDNIVAFWRPKDRFTAGTEYSYVYRLHWLNDAQGLPQLAKFAETRQGAGTAGQGARLFVLDAVGGRLKDLPADATPNLEVTAGEGGRIANPVAHRNPETGGWRVAFELLPAGNRPVELRAVLKAGDAPLTETWINRWTA